MSNTSSSLNDTSKKATGSLGDSLSKNLLHANEFDGVSPKDWKKSALPPLSDESISSNGRLAKSLTKTSDFSSIKRYIQPGLDKGDPTAIAETYDLIEQTNKLSPGHGDKLAEELGLIGGSGNDTFSAK